MSEEPFDLEESGMAPLCDEQQCLARQISLDNGKHAENDAGACNDHKQFSSSALQYACTAAPGGASSACEVTCCALSAEQCKYPAVCADAGDQCCAVQQAPAAVAECVECYEHAAAVAGIQSVPLAPLPVPPVPPPPPPLSHLHEDGAYAHVEVPLQHVPDAHRQGVLPAKCEDMDVQVDQKSDSDDGQQNAHFGCKRADSERSGSDEEQHQQQQQQQQQQSEQSQLSQQSQASPEAPVRAQGAGKRKKQRAGWGQGTGRQCKHKNIFKNFGNMILKYFTKEADFQKEIRLRLGANAENFLRWAKNEVQLESKRDFIFGYTVFESDSEQTKRFKRHLVELSVKFLEEYSSKFLNRSRMVEKDLHIACVQPLIQCVKNPSDFTQFSSLIRAQSTGTDN